jgi:predicted DNA-binding mobile mystery protein A
VGGLTFFEEDATMREKERGLARKKLDKELKYYRWAGKEKNPTHGLLRAVRHALGVPAAEMLKKLDVSPSVLFRLEKSERRGTISLKRLGRAARAMGCKLVYGIVPQQGKTLEDLMERRLWESVLGGVGVRN